MTMSSAAGFVRDVFVVARYEFQQAARTRLLQVGVLAYAAATAAAHYGFVRGLREAERSVASAMGVPPTEKPGALLGAALKSTDLRRFLADLLGSEDVLDRLADVPVLALWSGAVAMVLLPLFVLVGTSTAVSAEVETRSIRFLALRTERLPIVLGKLGGQLSVAMLAAASGVAVTVAVGLTLMVQQPPAGLAWGGAMQAARALVYALPFAAMGLAVSQWVPRANAARLVTMLLLFAVLFGHVWLEAEADATPLGRAADLGRSLLPGFGWVDTWSTEPLPFALAAARAGVLTVGWLGLGYLRFDRRDL
jgi:ABC-type transport system involved in multi-copper enzyme maturation permease subunit